MFSCLACCSCCSWTGVRGHWDIQFLARGPLALLFGTKQRVPLRWAQPFTDSCAPVSPGCHQRKQCGGAADPHGAGPAGGSAQTAAGVCAPRLAAGTSGSHQLGRPGWSLGQVRWEGGGGRRHEAVKLEERAAGILSCDPRGDRLGK